MNEAPANLKLLLYAHTWAPSVGGVETVTMTLARGFAAWSADHPQQQVSTTVVTNTPAGAMDDTRLPFRVVRRPAKMQLAGLVRSSDVVHVASPALPPLALAWMLRKPAVLEHDGYQAICPNGLLVYQPDRSVCPGHYMAGAYAACVRCNAATLGRAASLRLLLLTFPRRWLTRRVSRNIAPSRHIDARIDLPRTEWIYHGVPDSAVPARPPASRPPSFVFVGRLVPEKGVAVLLRAASGLAKQGYSFNLKIAGDGPERRNLENMAAGLGLGDRVEFLGTVSGDALPALAACAIAVIMPSVWEDIAPLAASEQLMQGNLLIASDIGGLGEIVGDAGLRFPAGEDAALQACMRRTLDDPSLVEDLRVRARRRGREVFEAGRMVADHVRLYQSLVAAER